MSGEVCSWCKDQRPGQRHWCAARDGYHDRDDCPCTGKHYR